MAPRPPELFPPRRHLSHGIKRTTFETFRQPWTCPRGPHLRWSWGTRGRLPHPDADTGHGRSRTRDVLTGILPEKVSFVPLVMAGAQLEGREVDGQRPDHEQGHRQGHEEHGQQQVGEGGLPGPARAAEPPGQEGGHLAQQQPGAPGRGRLSRRAICGDRKTRPESLGVPAPCGSATPATTYA